MKSAEEILREISTLCPKFPDPACRGICICKADLAAIRAAQIDAAEWMREEAAKACKQTADVFEANNEDSDARYPLDYAIAVIRAIKIPGNDADPI